MRVSCACESVSRSLKRMKSPGAFCRNGTWHLLRSQGNPFADIPGGACVQAPAKCAGDGATGAPDPVGDLSSCTKPVSALAGCMLQSTGIASSTHYALTVVWQLFKHTLALQSASSARTLNSSTAGFSAPIAPPTEQQPGIFPCSNFFRLLRPGINEPPGSQVPGPVPLCTFLFP